MTQAVSGKRVLGRWRESGGQAADPSARGRAHGLADEVVGLRPGDAHVDELPDRSALRKQDAPVDVRGVAVAAGDLGLVHQGAERLPDLGDGQLSGDPLLELHRLVQARLFHLR